MLNNVPTTQRCEDPQLRSRSDALQTLIACQRSLFFYDAYLFKTQSFMSQQNHEKCRVSLVFF
jgi:hypothetical protein